MSINEKKYSIEGMSCNHCVMHVTNSLKEIKGVESVIVDLAAKEAVVVGDSIDDSEIIHAVDEAGYTAKVKK